MFGDVERWKAIGTDNTPIVFETEIRLVDRCWTILYADGRTVLFIDPTFPSEEEAPSDAGGELIVICSLMGR